MKIKLEEVNRVNFSLDSLENYSIDEAIKEAIARAGADCLAKLIEGQDTRAYFPAFWKCQDSDGVFNTTPEDHSTLYVEFGDSEEQPIFKFSLMDLIKSDIGMCTDCNGVIHGDDRIGLEALSKVFKELASEIDGALGLECKN